MMQMNHKKPINPDTVLGKSIIKCRIAHRGGIPLILLDTEELQLVEEIALYGDLIDLLSANEDGIWRNYYTLLNAEPGGLTSCSNYCTDYQALHEIVLSNGNLKLSSSTPCLFVLHLTRASWNKKQNDEGSMVNALRAYVDAFLRCNDMSAPLRTSVVLLYGDIGLLPEDLKNITEIVDIPYPELKEIYSIAETIMQELETPLELYEDKLSISELLAGFSVNQVRSMMTRLILNVDEDGSPFLYDKDKREKLIREAKKQVLLQNGGLLELLPEPKKPKESTDGTVEAERPDELAGHQNFKKWAENNAERAKNSDAVLRACGSERLKGILLSGVPGCGKSEAAKILGQMWNLPTLKLSVDRLMSSYVGDSERNMRLALKQAEAMSPCILWIDELDKGFSGSASEASGDSGTFKRMFAYFLTWMQENRRPCFIFATANDISRLPSEFFRSGRFDECFSVFMPNELECKSLFKEHMKRTEERKKKAVEAASTDSTQKQTKLFLEECFNDDTMSAIMDLFLYETSGDKTGVLKTRDLIKFVSGGDIAKIVSYAVAKIYSKHAKEGEAKELISSSEWIQAVQNVIEDPSVRTYGCGNAGLDNIAACYARLMRGNFSPSSRMLLDETAYSTTWDSSKHIMVCRYQVSEEYLKTLSPYDRELHNTIASRFERIATTIENNALNTLCR